MHPNGGVYCFCLPHCGHDGPSRKSIGTVSTAVPGHACTQKRAGCSACPDAHVSFSLSLKSRSNRAIKFFPLRQRFLSPCRSAFPDSICKIAGPCDFSTHDRRWSALLTRNAYHFLFFVFIAPYAVKLTSIYFFSISCRVLSQSFKIIYI